MKKVTVEYVLTFRVSSPGEIEDIENRIHALNPDTIDLVFPEAPEWRRRWPVIL